MDEKYIRRARLKDKIASRSIIIGGIAVIASVIAILVLIAKVALPLFLPPKAKIIERMKVPASVSSEIIAVGIDDYRETAYLVDRDGVITFIKLADQKIILSQDIRKDSDAKIKSFDFYKNAIFNFNWDDNSLTSVELIFTPVFDENGRRSIVPKVDEIAEVQPMLDYGVPEAVLARKGEERFTLVAKLPQNRFHVRYQVQTTDLFDNVTTEDIDQLLTEKITGNFTLFTLDEPGNVLLAATDQGYLLRWDLSDPENPRLTDKVQVVAAGRQISALQFVFGDVSVAIADSSGEFSTWMPVRPESDTNIKKLNKIHELESHQSAIRKILPSRRTKVLWSLDESGVIHADHMTSENHLFDFTQETRLFGVSSRGNSLIMLDENNTLAVWDIQNHHPETNLRTLFGKVWYEGYDEPQYVWQSSAQTDDSEPKFSITPLIFGTMKGTFYAMIFAIPLAIFGAVYTSQFTTPAFKKAIKPAIEILASVPSVVIGFLIALWLAPIVEDSIMAVLLCLPILPIVFIVFMFFMQPLFGREKVKNFMTGYEFMILIPVVFITGVLAVFLAPTVENLLFQGDFPLWLYSELGMRYDQRNCIIIAFGLGICVIPIIFSITEDAISNIPPSLTAASLALGASRWQTVWRVIIPSASPGIFAAIIIGFGRAVGETMVVLMATGNTPIMDWSIFNGMRTLSANIAVEIPEAPVGGTLYRVLFLCATILFGLTFILNTGAEIIREHLRKKYGRY